MEPCACRPLREALGNDKWVLPLVHGFWEQRRLALFGRTLTLTVIARRSRQVSWQGGQEGRGQAGG